MCIFVCERSHCVRLSDALATLTAESNSGRCRDKFTVRAERYMCSTQWGMITVGPAPGQQLELRVQVERDDDPVIIFITLQISLLIKTCHWHWCDYGESEGFQRIILSLFYDTITNRNSELYQIHLWKDKIYSYLCLSPAIIKAIC